MVNPSTSQPSPLSPTRWPPDAFVWWHSLGFGFVLAAVAAITVNAFAFGLVAAHVATAQTFGGRTLTWQALATQLFSYAILIPLILWLLPRLARRSMRDLGLRPLRFSDAAWGLGGAIVAPLLAGIVAAVQNVLLHLPANEVQVEWLRNEHGRMIAGFAFLAIVAAPAFEELAFRGFLFNAVLRYVAPAPAMVIAGLLFGMIHWQPGNAGAILPLATVGVVLCAVYYRTGSLVASAISHGLFNAYTVIGIVFLHQT